MISPKTEKEEIKAELQLDSSKRKIGDTKEENSMIDYKIDRISNREQVLNNETIQTPDKGRRTPPIKLGSAQRTQAEIEGKTPGRWSKEEHKKFLDGISIYNMK